MSASPFDSAFWGALLGDAALAPLFDDRAELRALVEVERALARAGARVGVVPASAAETIDRTFADWAPEPAALAPGTASAGVPIPALLAAMRAVLDPEAAHWLHWGATSQDIVDTALALRLAAAFGVLEARLAAVSDGLADAAARWADLPMAGRTRSQVAAPIAFGDRCAAWAAPFGELRAELAILRPRVARVQFGGAVGTNAVLEGRGPAVAAALAAELGLADARPWHANRLAIGAAGAWLAGLAVASGKVAGDLVLMGRSESGEARAGAGGGSSTLPQKANPVTAETVVALARYAAALASPLHAAGLHAEERDGSAWTLEWLVLPQLVIAAGSALGRTLTLVEALAPEPARMRAVLEAGGGAAMAEAAVYLLAREMPRPAAAALVAEAVGETRSGVTLAAALARLAPGRDWAEALSPERLIARGRGET